MEQYNNEIIEILNNPKLNWEQTDEIEMGFDSSLTIKQILTFAKPEFNWRQMEAIRLGFQNGLTMEQILTFANPKYDWRKMYLIRECLEKNIPQDIMEYYSNKNIFNKEQMYEISRGFDNKLTMEQIQQFANAEIYWEKMYLIRECLEKNIPQEKMEYYSNENIFNKEQMYSIARSFDNNLTIKQIEVFAKPEFNWIQMEEISSGFENGLSLNQISIYAKPEFNDEQMNQIYFGFINRLSIEQVKLYTNPRYSHKQMKIYREALEINLPIKDKFNPSLTVKEMKKIVTDLKKKSKISNSIHL